MKRTTYILIGLFIGGFVLLFAGMVAIYLNGKVKTGDVVLGGKTVSREFPPFKVLVLGESIPEDARGSYYRVWGRDFRMEIQPSQDGKNVFSFPEDAEKFLNIRQYGDTLKIMSSFHWKKQGDGYNRTLYPGTWQLSVPSDIEFIANDMSDQEMILKNFSQDSLTIDASAAVTINNSHFKAFRVQRNERQLKLESGSIGNLYLDIDRMGNWYSNPDHFTIHTEYLTGNKGSVELAKGECKRMYWLPKSQDSKLEVTLREKSCVVIGE